MTRESPPCQCRSCQDLLTVDDAAARLGVSRRALLRWAREGGLPLFRLAPSSPLFARWSSIEAWAAEVEAAARR
jgi:hypothetical protein